MRDLGAGRSGVCAAARAHRFTVVAAGLGALCLTAGCHRGESPCAPGLKSSLEVRDGSGALSLSVKDRALCDSGDRLVATIDARGDALTLNDPKGGLLLGITRQSPEVAIARDADGPHLRLYRDARELRVLRSDGVPLGSMVPAAGATPANATVYSPASQPYARSAARDRGAVVTDLGGSVLVYLGPKASPAPAGVFAIGTLKPAEQVALYLFWSR